MNATRTKTGWHPVRASDLKVTGTWPGTCGRCGRRDLRFLHTVADPDGTEHHVGSECARRLCYGYSPEREEGRLRNLWQRRSRWLTRNWGRSWNGNETLTFPTDGHAVRVTVFAGRFGGWSFCVGYGDDRVFAPRAFESVDEAKLAAFDEVARVAGW